MNLSTSEPPHPAADDENAFRLVLKAWFKDGQLTSAAFHTRSPANPKYVAISLFIKERLAGQDGDVLHVERFASRGRARLAVRHIRSASHVSGGVKQPIGFDLLMTGTADPPLDPYGVAHAELQGPTQRPSAARAMAVAFNQYGYLERTPV